MGLFYWMLNMEVGNSDSLADQIKVQGDLVRRLKQEKAAKDKVRFYTFKIMLMLEKGEERYNLILRQVTKTKYATC